MTKTFNRQPMFVNTPSQSAVKNYFFNHNKFKGLNDDRNFVEVDQETFQDCKNVFVDAESILRSRHAVKIKIVTWKNGSQTVQLANVIDVEVFGDTVVYNSTDGTNYYLTFVNSNFEQNVQQNLGTSNEYKLVISEHKIFIFTSTSLNYYDVDTNTILNGTSFIYVPITKTVSGGVETELESPNELTTSYITRYLFNNISDVDFAVLEGKQVTITVGNETYNVTFTYGSQYSYFVNRRALPSNAYSDQYIFGKNGNGIPLVQNIKVNNYSITLLCTEDTTLGTAENNNVPTCDWKIYWSINDITYNKLPDTDGVLSMPRLSEDGSLACVLKNDGIYVISLVSGDYGTLTYSDWTKLPDTGTQHNRIVTTGTIPIFNQNVQNAFCVLDDTTYYILDATNTSAQQWPRADSTGTYIDNQECILYIISNGVRDGIVISDSSNNTVIPDLNIPLLKVYDNIAYLYLGGRTSGTLFSYYSILNSYTMNSSNEVVLVNSIRNVDAPCFPYKKDDVIVNNGYVIYSSGYQIFNSGLEIHSYNLSNNVDTVLVSYTITQLTYDKVTIDVSSTPQSLRFMYESGVMPGYTVFYYDGVTINTNKRIYVLSMYNNSIVGICDGYIVNNDLSDQNATIDLLTEGTINYIVPDHFAEVDNYYFSKGNTIYISALSEYMDGFKWYFPQINTEEFDYPITNLHPISTTELAIFQEDAIYYIVKQYNEQLGLYTYSYFKTRVNIGCKEGCDVITTFDGKYTLFASKRGLVAMSYQEFISSTEQALTYISDSIYSLFEAFNISPIKLYQHGYWIYVYRQDSNYCLVFDVRNNSWWPFMYKYNCTKFLAINNKTHFICMTQLHSTYEGFGQYASEQNTDIIPYEDVYYVMQKVTSITDGGQQITENKLAKLPVQIDWYILSQKLHLNALNYYKHIVNLTLNNVIDKKQRLSFTFTVKNYRTDITKDAIGSIVQDGFFNNGKTEDKVVYTVDTISTFVQRVNFSKVTEFQFILESNTKKTDTDSQLVALSLSNITIKYKIGSQVR